jgi:RimJ/RimL family protein N-acetyltransferase
LFIQQEPPQILFAFFHDEVFVAYGGLVHINWLDGNAEISFLMDTSREANFFAQYWTGWLTMIEQVAFSDLKLHKLYTYAFDVRPHLYPVLENSGYYREAELKEHCHFHGEWKSVVIHSKLNR